MPNRARKFRTLHKFGKRQKKCAVQPKESSQPAQATFAEPSGTGDWQSPRCSSLTQRQPSIATTSTSGDTRSECHKSSQLPTKISADPGGRAQRIPQRSGVATQAIATTTTVPSKSADCGDTYTSRQETMPPLVIKTAKNAAAADLAARESVAATATAACSTSSMRNRAARIDATFLKSSDREVIERCAQQKAVELSLVSATDRKMSVLASQRGTESSSAPLYTMFDLDMVNSLLNEHSACRVCRGHLTIERDTREYGVAVKLKLHCSNCEEVGLKWSSRQVSGSSNCNPFEIQRLHGACSSEHWE
ncbi:hypothetical protein HPB51_029725 [Rhipicephalus microplus]|uniref:Uncharacterized protein n=1 Tax=Rhipicephalus microplus TaxID=6941 RepID=A0A9J6CU16_RHIMP|nr:hypothetical protein HPB51_029725 [Rhipicephalus microplus]